ncbi:MAG TPA: glycosyltransferase family 39 protein [Acidimicrobiales bacterium]|nr:glycosyltransferase family 39 protein [Acidimicrobiales bacterium]
MPSSRADAGPPPVLVVALVLAVVAGVVLRAWSRSDLWLDEALTVNIASLPVGEMVDALERDGHPPLYYLLLHGWMRLVGSGDLAVRTLSGLLGVVALPLMALVGRRHGGAPVAVAALVILTTSPFAVRYATEVRMYALVIVLVLLGWLALRQARSAPSAPWLVAVAAVSGLLLLTHYWAFFLLAAVGGALAWEAWRVGPGDLRRTATRLAVGVAAGGILFLPWLPSFLVQAGSTGTPWGRPERPATVLMVTLRDFGGGANAEAELLGFLLLALVAIGLLGRAVGSSRVELDLRTRPGVRPEAVVVGATLGIGVVAGYVFDSAFASRYAAIILPLVVLMAAVGVVQLPRASVQAGVLAVLAVLGLLGGARNLVTQRTQAGQVASAVTATASSGDVVAYCPDQLGPAVSRLLPDDLRQLALADDVAPHFVDWVDYADRMAEADTAAFAAEVDELAGDRTVWLVWSGGYRTLEGTCEALTNDLAVLRPDRTVMVESGEQFEHAWLFRFGPTG